MLRDGNKSGGKSLQKTPHLKLKSIFSVHRFFPAENEQKKIVTCVSVFVPLHRFMALCFPLLAYLILSRRSSLGCFLFKEKESRQWWLSFTSRRETGANVSLVLCVCACVYLCCLCSDFCDGLIFFASEFLFLHGFCSFNNDLLHAFVPLSKVELSIPSINLPDLLLV